MSAQPIRRWDREIALLAWLTTCVSILAFLFYFRRGEILLYGDAVAHINIARRVFDSRTPGLLQLGTVWLPLPHLLMIPFLLSNWMWKTGVGGSIPSMAAYVLGTIGIFRLVRDGLGPDAQSSFIVKAAAWLAAIIYAANPNLIYLQATAMTEALYLALFIWAMVYFNEFVRESAKLRRKSPPVRFFICTGQMRSLSCRCVLDALRRVVSGGCDVCYCARGCATHEKARHSVADWQNLF